MKLLGIHHIAIICSDYDVSKRFYTEILGCTVISEHYRAERESFKLDLLLPDQTQIELFSFPSPPQRLSQPEALGLRHLALKVADINAAANELNALGIPIEEVRVDELTGKKYTFFADPDELPIELCED